MSDTTVDLPVKQKTIGRLLVLQAAVKVLKGTIAVIDTATGYVTKGQPGIGYVRIGTFAQDSDNSAGSAGGVSVNVELDKEIAARYWANDAGTPVTQAQMLQDCYILDNHTVTGDADGASVAGRIWGVDSQGVLVENNFHTPGAAALPKIQSGSATLVLGTKTITADITATSRIFLTRKAAGGTVTTTVMYETGTRTPGTPGSFVINAVTSADAVLTTDTSVIDWLVIG